MLLIHDFIHMFVCSCGNSLIHHCYPLPLKNKTMFFSVFFFFLTAFFKDQLHSLWMDKKELLGTEPVYVPP